MGKYLINGLMFTSQQKIKTYTRNKLTEIFNKVEYENVYIKPNDMGYDFILEILNRHPWKEEKIGRGINFFILNPLLFSRDKIPLQRLWLLLFLCNFYLFFTNRLSRIIFLVRLMAFPKDFRKLDSTTGLWRFQLRKKPLLMPSSRRRFYRSFYGICLCKSML